MLAELLASAEIVRWKSNLFMPSMCIPQVENY
jgi:hypothetical protein